MLPDPKIGEHVVYLPINTVIAKSAALYPIYNAGFAAFQKFKILCSINLGLIF